MNNFRTRLSHNAQATATKVARYRAGGDCPWLD
jgi:hypothetical protein